MRKPPHAFSNSAAVQRSPNILLRLPALRDNAGMEEELCNADPLKRKRRCPQYTLHDMMVGVTLVSVGCAGIRLVCLAESMAGYVGLLIVFASGAAIGAGAMAPFHRKRIGAVLGAFLMLFFLIGGTVWFVLERKS